MTYPSNGGPDLDSEFGVTGEQLKSFIERIEQLDAEIKDIQDSRKEVYSEAKAFGFDAKVIRAVIQRRKKDADSLAEFEALLELYLNALEDI